MRGSTTTPVAEVTKTIFASILALRSVAMARRDPVAAPRTPRSLTACLDTLGAGSQQLAAHSLLIRALTRWSPVRAAVGPSFSGS
jgi:hypothetical protein